MILIKSASDLHSYLDKLKRGGGRIGFTPTMGALHAGHMSLIQKSLKENDFSVCSIFINPTQFNDPTDYKKYPVTIDQDIYKLIPVGCDVLFLPTVQEMYPDGQISREQYDLGNLETILEGKYRPGHFQGVCQVVHRLINLVRPHNLYLGQKDFQQSMVLSRLIDLLELKDQIQIHVCPTLREPDGLAMSSRNSRLNAEERKKAPGIYEALTWIRSHLSKGKLEGIKNHAKEMLLQKGFRMDYVEIADAGTLELLSEWDGRKKVIALIAAFLNEVWLIDNMMLNKD